MLQNKKNRNNKQQSDKNIRQILDGKIAGRNAKN